MTFSEYAKGLFPYISYGKSKSDYFTELVGNFIQDAAMDACQLLKYKDDTKYRHFRGVHKFKREDLQYLYDHRDKEKFSDWVWARIDDTSSYDKISAWLISHNISSDDPATACADLLESIILDTINNIDSSPPSQKSDLDLTLINDIQEKIKSLPRPAKLPVPKEATQNEETYINELLSAYGDAEGMNVFSTNDLSSFPDYEEDLNGRRIDFYAAESIRRGVLELGSGSLTDQFDVLKSETLVGVIDTAKRTHPNGYERMLAVMEQAISTPMTNYVLSSSPYWIGGKIKKGVCHHLVNDGKLSWIRRRKKQ